MSQSFSVVKIIMVLICFFLTRILAFFKNISFAGSDRSDVDVNGVRFETCQKVGPVGEFGQKKEGGRKRMQNWKLKNPRMKRSSYHQSI